jgi:hypothetical protein
VLAGRAQLYGLASVRHCIDILAQALRMTMHLSGAADARGRRQEPTAGQRPAARRGRPRQVAVTCERRQQN